MDFDQIYCERSEQYYFQEEYIMKEKVVLAYSGGLDTTALIPWLKETFDYEVICCCVNCGQGNELDVWTKEQNFPELPNCISKTLLMISATTT